MARFSRSGKDKNIIYAKNVVCMALYNYRLCTIMALNVAVGYSDDFNIQKYYVYFTHNSKKFINYFYLMTHICVLQVV